MNDQLLALGDETIPAATRSRRTTRKTVAEQTEGAATAGVGAEPSAPESQPSAEATGDAMPASAAEAAAQEAQSSAEVTESPSPSRKAPTKEEKRRRNTEAARAQRRNHAVLLSEWMPTQRGAVIQFVTSIGHQAVESWYKRTFLKAAKQLWKIHTFHRGALKYDEIAQIEQKVLDKIAASEKKLNNLIQQLDALIVNSGATMGVFQKAFGERVEVSTRTAVKLHGLYAKADAAGLRLETLSLHGFITAERYAKGLKEMHDTIFSAASAIEVLFTGIYIKLGQKAPSIAEEVASETTGQAGLPHDQQEPAPVETEGSTAEHAAGGAALALAAE